MTPADFEFLRKLLKDRSGLMLSGDKQYLLESRLVPVARKNGLATLGELTARLKAAPHAPLASHVVDAMTTNETFFFRDKLPFDYFRGLLLPTLLAARAGERRLRIWCAACANGQEPYSLAMSLRELGPALGAWKIEILATDISNDALEKAKAGLYSQFEVQRGLPIALLVKYLVQTGDLWQITPDVRAMVTYRPFNLLNDFSGLGTFDVIFCRNVLIYFDQQTKIGVLKRLAHTAADDGYLVLGAAETTVGLTDAFKPLHEYRGVYVPNAARIPYVVAPPLASAKISGPPRSASADNATAKGRESSPP